MRYKSIEKDKYIRLIIKAKNTMDKILEVEEKGVSKNAAAKWNGLNK